jgi:hypothetical protein
MAKAARAVRSEARGLDAISVPLGLASESVNDSLFVGLSIALALGRYVTPFRGDLASFSPDHA